MLKMNDLQMGTTKIELMLWDKNKNKIGKLKLNINLRDHESSEDESESEEESESNDGAQQMVEQEDPFEPIKIVKHRKSFRKIHPSDNVVK